MTFKYEFKKSIQIEIYRKYIIRNTKIRLSEIICLLITNIRIKRKSFK